MAYDNYKNNMINNDLSCKYHINSLTKTKSANINV